MERKPFKISLQIFESATLKIAGIQTDALAEIIRAEVSQSGARQMKGIAERALVESHKIASETKAKVQENLKGENRCRN